MKRTCWDTRATDSIIKSGHKGTEASIHLKFVRPSKFISIQFPLHHGSASHCFRNSSLTIIWNNLGLSNYKLMKRNPGFRKKHKHFYRLREEGGSGRPHEHIIYSFEARNLEILNM